MRLEALLPADSITCCKQLPLRSNTCPAGGLWRMQQGMPWHGCEKAWQFYSSTQPYPTYRFLWVNDTNTNPSCKQISWMFNDFHASVSSTHKLNMPGTLSWYSSRLAHCTLSICQKLTQCPSHEATKVLLPCCGRNLCQVECIDGVKKILSLAFIATLDSIAVDHRPGRFRKAVARVGFWVYCWCLGKGNEEAECNHQKMGTLWWTRCGVSWKFWTNMTKQYFGKKSDGWPKVLDSKEWRTPIKHHVQCTIYVFNQVKKSLSIIIFHWTKRICSHLE